MSDLICPKDQTPMRSIERNGVTIERCSECGGMFLDRGELERLFEAEGAYATRQDQGARSDRDGGHGSSHGSSHGQAGSGRKRRGFLQNLLEGD